MDLPRITMTKGAQQAVFQGTIHIAPARLYEIIQKDVDEAVKNGAKIFYEGISNDDVQPRTANEAKIRRFCTLLIEHYPFFAQAFGICAQKDAISYPPDAINADMTLSRMCRLLDENGFHCRLLLKVLSQIEKEPLRGLVRSRLSQMSWVELFEQAGRQHTGRIQRLLWRKAIPIILDHRNEVGFSIFKGQAAEGNLIHYGKRHIEGLVSLAEQDGWQVTGRQKIILKIA